MSSYIAFDLDALNVCPQVGTACGLSAADVTHGLLQLWAYCFRAETDTVTAVHVRGFFAGTDATPALEAFGFLAASENGWRVRGADRYLRLKEARRKGGQAAKKHLIPGARQAKASRGGSPEVSPDQSREAAERQPRESLGSLSALSPNTEHRTPNTRKDAGAPKALKTEKPPPDPRHAPMVRAFCEAFERETGAKYPFSGLDAAAVTALLAKGLEPTLLAAWTKALRSTGYPVVRTLPELARNLAHFIGAAPPTGSTRVDESTKVYPEGNFL